MKRLLLLLASFLILPGFTSCQKKEENITLVPVVVDAPIEKPSRPRLASEDLSKESSQDDTIKAAISDVKSLKSYSEKLERLLK